MAYDPASGHKRPWSVVLADTKPAFFSKSSAIVARKKKSE
jgi:hypothetical protein